MSEGWIMLHRQSLDTECRELIKVLTIVEGE